jgi:hypothetical protein
VSPLSDYLGLLGDVAPPPVTTPPEAPVEPRVRGVSPRPITGSESGAIPGGPSRPIT